jgi:hypothetical protein
MRIFRPEVMEGNPRLTGISPAEKSSRKDLSACFATQFYEDAIFLSGKWISPGDGFPGLVS